MPTYKKSRAAAYGMPHATWRGVLSPGIELTAGAA